MISTAPKIVQEAQLRMMRRGFKSMGIMKNIPSIPTTTLDLSK